MSDLTSLDLDMMQVELAHAGWPNAAKALASLRAELAALRAEHTQLVAALKDQLDNPRPMYFTDTDYPEWDAMCGRHLALLSACRAPEPKP